MSSISVSDIEFSSEYGLINGEESFLNEVSEQELTNTLGGVTPVVTFTATSLGSVSVWGTSFGTGFAIGAFTAGGVVGYTAASRK